MKRKTLLILSTMSFAANQLFAQEMFGDFAKNMQDEVEGYFPYVIAVIFVISALFNMGKFFGEDRDVKKGISNILLFVGGTLLVMGAYKYLTGMTL